MLGNLREKYWTRSAFGDLVDVEAVLHAFGMLVANTLRQSLKQAKKEVCNALAKLKPITQAKSQHNFGS